MEIDLDGFRQFLKDCKYGKSVICNYVRSAREYLSTGLPADKETICRYYKEQGEAGHISPRDSKQKKPGVMAYVRYINGEKPGKQLQIRPTNERWLGCDEDCFHCVYSDCIKPDKFMREEIEH